MKTIKLI